MRTDLFRALLHHENPRGQLDKIGGSAYTFCPAATGKIDLFFLIC